MAEPGAMKQIWEKSSCFNMASSSSMNWIKGLHWIYILVMSSAKLTFLPKICWHWSKEKYIKYLTKGVVNLIKYWLELFCNITGFIRSLAKIFEQFINIEQMFLFTALFVIEGDKFSSHDYWLPRTAYSPTVLDIFHIYGRVVVTLTTNAIMWLTRVALIVNPLE